MAQTQETISKRTLVLRYAALTVLTAYLTTMIAISFMLLQLEVRYSENYIGWSMSNVSGFWGLYDLSRVRKSGGAIIESVEPLSPAEQGGLYAGDTITALNGVDLTKHPETYFQFLIHANPGDSTSLTVRRGSTTRLTKIVTANRDSFFQRVGYLGVSWHFLNRDSLIVRKLNISSGVLVEDVEQGTAAELAGIQVGDILTSVNQSAIDSASQFTRILRMSSPGEHINLQLLREGIPNTLTVILSSTPPRKYYYGFFGSVIEGSPAIATWLYYFPWLLLMLSLFIVGVFIGWVRPKDYVAFDAAMLFLCFGTTVTLTNIPNVASLPIWFQVVFISGSNLFAPLAFPISLRLLSVFPIQTTMGKIFLRWQWIAFVLFGLYGIQWFIHEISSFYGWYDPFPVPIKELWPSIILSIGMVMLIVAQRIASRPQPQNRLRLFEFSVLLGAISLVFLMLNDVLFSIVPEWLKPVYGYLTYWFPILSWVVFPIAFAYSVLAKKLFDIRFFIRKGLRYLLLSKGALLVEGIIVFLVVIQILSYAGTEFLNSPTAVGGIAVASTLAVIAVVGKVNRKLMPAIDRRFFREALDVKRLLMELNEKLSEMKEREKILQQTASTVLKALHPARVVILMKHGKSDEFRCELTLENKRAKQSMAVTDQSVTVTESTVQCHGVDRDTPAQSPTVIARSESDEVGRVTKQSDSSEQVGLLHPVDSSITSGLSTGFAMTAYLKVDDTIIEQMEEKKGWAIIYPETLSREKEEDQRLSVVNCELLIAIKGSTGLVGIIGLGGKLSEEPYSKEDRELLMTVAREMGLALENAELLEVAKREAEYSKELDIARQVQQNLFPTKLPTPSGWEFAGICKPAKAVGGDYYDIFEAVPGKVVVALGDVSGKGLGASFVMSGVHSTIRTNAEKSIDNPVGLINELNKYLLSSTSKNIFVTLFLGIIDLESGKVSYVNCGHPPAFVVRKENSEIEKLTRTGLALGMMSTVQFTQGSSTLKTGDSLIVYSDGVTETMNERGEMFEEERLIQVLKGSENIEANQIMDLILENVMAFAGTHEQADDISVIVVRRLKI